MKKTTTVLTISVVLLTIVCVCVGLVGYYSAGFSDWSDFEEAFSIGKQPANETPGDDGNVKEPVAAYKTIHLNDLLPRVYFNKDFDVKGYINEMYPNGLTDEIGIKISNNSRDGHYDQDRNLILAPLSKISDFKSLGIEYAPNDFAIILAGPYIPSGYEATNIFYVSRAIESDSLTVQEGWLTQNEYFDLMKLDFDNPGESMGAADNQIRVIGVHGQDVFRNFMSADGVFYDAAEQNIASLSYGITAGDIVPVMYFNTDFDVKAYFETLPQGLGLAAMMSTVIGDISKESYFSLMVCSIAMFTGVFQDYNEIVIVATSNTDTQIIYSSKACDIEGFAVETPGWQCDKIDFREKGLTSYTAQEPTIGMNLCPFISAYDIFSTEK